MFDQEKFSIMFHHIVRTKFYAKFCANLIDIKTLLPTILTIFNLLVTNFNNKSNYLSQKDLM